MTAAVIAFLVIMFTGFIGFCGLAWWLHKAIVQSIERDDECTPLY